VAKLQKHQKVRKPSQPPQKRTYLKQSDVPNASLDEALRIPQALFDHYAGKSASPMQLAKALNMAPNGSQIVVLSGAAIAFGLIEGGAQAAAISPTELSRRVLRPKAEGEDFLAKQEAILKPRIFSEFLRNYDGSPIPRRDIAQNVLESMGVPRERTEEVFDRILSSAQSVGFLQEIKGKQYFSLNSLSAAAAGIADADPMLSVEQPADDHLLASAGYETTTKTAPVSQPTSTALTMARMDDVRRSRVFITHGKNVALVEPIKKLLEFGELEPVISVEKQSVSKPVPEKVMDDMRGCGAAIIHVEAETTILDHSNVAHVFLNPNVLIEIGAAMAFYGRRFILLVRDGVQLPSNLQGLYEVRYSGATLDATSTIKLLEAIKDIKNYALPTDANSA
jgi:predicted nucleotide-binding protein